MHIISNECNTPKVETKTKIGAASKHVQEYYTLQFMLIRQPASVIYCSPANKCLQFQYLGCNSAVN